MGTNKLEELLPPSSGYKRNLYRQGMTDTGMEEEPEI
jgi:hypothetical protein